MDRECDYVSLINMDKFAGNAVRLSIWPEMAGMEFHTSQAGNKGGVAVSLHPISVRQVIEE